MRLILCYTFIFVLIRSGDQKKPIEYVDESLTEINDKIVNYLSVCSKNLYDVYFTNQERERGEVYWDDLAIYINQSKNSNRVK